MHWARPRDAPCVNAFHRIRRRMQAPGPVGAPGYLSVDRRNSAALVGSDAVQAILINRPVDRRTPFRPIHSTRLEEGNEPDW